jgi:hypothetical protein
MNHRNQRRVRGAAALAAGLVGLAGPGVSYAQQQPQQQLPPSQPRTPPEQPMPKPEPGPKPTPQPSHPMQGVPQPQADTNDCPEVMRGVTLVLMPSERGVTLDFTSPRTEMVPELRSQLREAAVAIEQHSESPPQSTDPADSDAVTIPPLDISVNDVGSGARVVIRAERPEDVEQLREIAQALEVMWLKSDCRLPPTSQAAPPLVPSQST